MSRKKLSISKDFSDRLRAVMHRLGFVERKQSEFANKIGISAAFLSDVLNLKSGPSFGLISGISNIFPSVDTNWLLTGEGEMLRKDQKETYIYKDEDPEIAELLEGARKVLKSGNRLAFEALERNIRYFSHAIETEKRLVGIESQLSDLKAELRLLKRRQADTGRIRKEDRPENGEAIIKRRVM